MTVAVVHATTAAGPNDPSKQVSSDAWNAGHTVTGLAAVASSGSFADLSGVSNVWEMRNGSSSQTLRLYNSFTDVSNYDRFSIVATLGTLRIQTESAGTGTLQNMIFAAGGTDHWQIIASGGVLRPATDNSRDIGATTLRIRNLYVGTALIGSGSITTTSASSGVGYATGAGGTVAQATSKSTGVTLNKTAGAITMNAAALLGATMVTFTVTNSAVAATDVIVANVSSGGTASAYRAFVTAVAAGSFALTVENITAGPLSESPVISFAVIKAVTA